MSAEIYGDDLAVYAQTAWHGKGITYGHLLSANEYAENPWQFRATRQDLYVEDMIDGEIVYIPVSEWDVTNGFVIRRNDNGFPLNVGVTEGRGITQYDEMDSAVEKLIEHGFSPGVASKGTINHGRKAYVTLEMGEPIDIEGDQCVTHVHFPLDGVGRETVPASGDDTGEDVGHKRQPISFVTSDTQQSPGHGGARIVRLFSLWRQRPVQRHGAPLLGIPGHHALSGRSKGDVEHCWEPESGGCGDSPRIRAHGTFPCPPWCHLGPGVGEGDAYASLVCRQACMYGT